MSCLEKRHTSHRMGSMLHHRFPNRFTDLFMDETDREVSTLTDRAFRSLCIGDDAVYNDDFLYGYSPYSCLKPLAGEPLKKTHSKESKKGQNKPEKCDSQPWKQKQQNISHMSSFLKVLSAAEESCEGLLITNGDVTDSNGESWDKSALRSIERELSEFSSDYHTSLKDRHHKNYLPHQSGSGSSNKKGKDAGLPSGKSTKNKNGKSAVKLKKLNITNFFLHSELSPFQTWTDVNRYPFGQEDTVANILSADNIPKWYDLPFYKELTEEHRNETLHTEESIICQKEAVEPSDAKALKPTPAPPPPKVLPKPSAPPAEKRCSSDGGDVHAAPWRRNKSRAKSAVPVNQTGIPTRDSNPKVMNESLLSAKKELKSVEVKAVQEVSSLASTPFSICQLMTPIIPSRQPTETSEILQAVLSPSALDLLGRPHSEAKGTPEPPVKRESYKSLASSILFNLKDNRKRVKSRYSPPKFKSSDPPDGDAQSPQEDHVTQAASEGSGSGLSTPALLKEGLPFCTPTLEPIISPNVDYAKQHREKSLSDDYLLANLLQSKRDSSHGEESPISPFISSKKNKSPMSKKQNYPSLNLYRKASPVDSRMKYLQVPQSSSLPAKTDLPTETKDKELPPNVLPKPTGLSPSTLNVINDYSPIISPRALENWGLSGRKRPPNIPEKTKWALKDANEKDFTEQESLKENDPGGQTISTMNVIRAAREAINAAKNKARSASYPDSNNKQVADSEELRPKNQNETSGNRRESLDTETNVLSQNDETSATVVSKNSIISKEPPPVPKRNFAKSDVQASLDKQQRLKAERPSNSHLLDEKQDSAIKEKEPGQKQDKAKHIFSSKLNNYIKHQRYAETDDEQTTELEESSLNVNTKAEPDNDVTLGDMRDSEHICNDLQALKDLEKARFGDRMLENAKRKLEALKIDEEAKARNDLISRELRNIKRGMLSMRGNTSAKRKLFAKQEKEQTKQETFNKLDTNVIVNKALINDNYDKAKMALEEVISERERRRKTFTEQDSILTSEITDDSSEMWLQEGKKGTKDCVRELKDEQDDSTCTVKELKTRSDDFKEPNQQRNIQAQPVPGESQRSSGRVEFPGMDMVDEELNNLLKAKHVRGNSEVNVEGHSKSRDEGGNTDKKFDTPPVPPRNKKGGNKRDGSTTEEKDAEDEFIFTKRDVSVKAEELSNMSSDLQESDCKNILPCQKLGPSYRESQDEINHTNIKLVTATDENRQESKLTSNPTLSEYTQCLSPKLRDNKNKAHRSEFNMNPTKKSITDSQETCKKKRKAPLKPDDLIRLDENTTRGLKSEEQPDKTCKEDINVDEEVLREIPGTIVSPLLLVNGISITQSPPDQASLSSKSSYFSVESALHRNTETESNIYHSLENLTPDVEEVDGPWQTVSPKDPDRAVMEYYSISDHERELEVLKKLTKFPQRDSEDMDGKDKENGTKFERVTPVESDPTMSPTNTFSPTLGIPALFKVKDNTFSSKIRKPVAPWTPRGSLNISQRPEEELHQANENPELLMGGETPTNDITSTSTESFQPRELSSQSPALQLSPSNIQSENTKKSQAGSFLTVPKEKDKCSRVTPSSEGVESATGSTADTADEAAMNTDNQAGSERTKASSDHSGSICSGSDSQTGLPKPPAVLPKSDQAVQKAIKLTNRRIKKEESQKLSHKTPQISSKHKSERAKSDKSEQKTSRGAKTGRNGEKKHREKNQDRHNDSHQSSDSTTQRELLPGYTENHQIREEMSHKTQRLSQESTENLHQSKDALNPALERQGRSSERHGRDKPEQRRYSSDRTISNLPVYKACSDQMPVSDRPFHRSQSIDRYLGGKVERRLSADVSASEKPDPRSQRIEKSIMHELQQRGRVRDKASGGNLLRRSHSIDAYSTEAPSLSRQSSHTSQLSRQSSIEHAIVTQSFPLTQRKLLQDPDSGQYYFVDLPVQVKTKTFIDPHTGSYVQLPVQPTDGAVPQLPHMEVLTPPMVVYHRFVPVPLSPMAQNAAIQAPHLELDDFEQRHLDRVRQMHCKEGHPYLQPVYGQHDHMLGDFMGTEELDCPS